jgi:hypothetical protein
MQTTLRLDEDLYRRAKSKASELGLSFTRFLEETLAERLDRPPNESSGKIRLPVSSSKGSRLSQIKLKERIARAALDSDLGQKD